jgi:hypothetical protein
MRIPACEAYETARCAAVFSSWKRYVQNLQGKATFGGDIPKQNFNEHAPPATCRTAAKIDTLAGAGFGRVGPLRRRQNCTIQNWAIWLSCRRTAAQIPPTLFTLRDVRLGSTGCNHAQSGKQILG